jgi:hypothetical protein
MKVTHRDTRFLGNTMPTTSSRLFDDRSLWNNNIRGKSHSYCHFNTGTKTHMVVISVSDKFSENKVVALLWLPFLQSKTNTLAPNVQDSESCQSSLTELEGLAEG